jgi:arabinose-5-phosphate isomerase
MNIKETIRNSILGQAHSLISMAENDNNPYEEVIKLILSVKGKVVFTGMGKSGIIAHKLAATFSSTGVPSFFVHPGEAYHGDLGMIEENDVVFAFSNSGETSELLNMLKFSRSKNIIGVSKSNHSSLSKYSKVHLECKVDKEICPLNLAPTTSTTAALVLGDAICAAIMRVSNFGENDFAKFHPGGSLGRSLLTKAKDLMNTNIPFVKDDASINEILLTISEGRLGLVCVGDESYVKGIITDGDIRRALSVRDINSRLKASNIMNNDPYFVHSNTGLTEMNNIFRDKKILSLLVGSRDELKGVVQYYDIHNG